MADTPVDNVDTPQDTAPEAAEASGTAEKPAKKAAAKKAPAKKAAAKKAPAKKATAKKAPVRKKAADEASAAEPASDTSAAADSGPAVLFQVPDVAPVKKSRAKAAAKPKATESEDVTAEDVAGDVAEEKAPKKKAPAKKAAARKTSAKKAPAKAGDKTGDKTGDKAGDKTGDKADEKAGADETPATDTGSDDTEDSDSTEGENGEGTSSSARRRRRRGGRRRRKPAGEGGGGPDGDEDDESTESAESAESGDPEKKTEGKASSGGAKDAGDAAADSDDSEGGSSSSRRRRRRRREGEGADASDDPNTVVKVRKARSPEDEITAVSGSTRLEAKKQRRREGREAGRRRASIVSEAEFLARRESVERVMVVRQRKDLTQIAVLEDKVLVEHYVARESQTSLIGNVYLGRVQNVLPSMEAAFIDIGKGRNAVLYAGEVNWSALGHKEGTPRKIESVLSSGQTVLVQVTKDPIGHKGARLTSQISLAGRFLVYVPDGTTSGISRKLPDTERARLKTLLKEIVPDTAGVIVRTAAEGASEEELTRDVERLKARWEDVEAKAAKGNSPQLLYGEPDLTLKVVRDLFTEDFAKLVVQGEDAWQTVHEYVEHVAPDLSDRLEHYQTSGDGDSGQSKPDVFATYRIDEQIAKGLDRKVWLPSGGSLIIDRTEAMTVVDVNTGKFTGSGGNLEETVTKNNLEAAEEIVRQLRLRDIGGIIVVDFIDMVLESNRDLVLRRLVECLGRDRTRHQVAEVTSLGLVQMTRKRIGTGLLEAFSETCDHCQGRGLVVHDLPVEPRRGGGGGGGSDDDARRGGGRRRRGRGGAQADEPTTKAVPSPKDVAAMAKAHAAEADADDADEDEAHEAAADEPMTDETATDAATAPEVTPEVTAEVTEEPAAEEPAAEEPVPEEPAAEEPAAGEEPEPEAPKVVTRTRRRAASRPAGPPAGGAVAEVTVDPGTQVVVESPVEKPQVEHVPIKQKGSRKR
ncbi:ribonuclease E/G [Nocardioides silvaticus]|uniref:Ribonuclease E n=1 Tax=Nocardioides silvaticus TaxID=2201891 RepID=A0A316TEM8_9ACTN|nr:Rne/Rng family ribonuclease [Nocardioides silvaticus]PWN01569.1 ribonuclease E/G [Nocardioides silvaticus]